MPTPPEPPDSNPYVVSEVTDRVIDPLRSRQPGLVAIFFSVVVGLVVACLTFGATFFVTCLGLTSTTSMNNEFGVLAVFGIAGLTAIAAFVFTLWGVLKIVRAMKQ
ncbi:MAG TPA: hypothetical protein PK992_18830 [Planctomycetaceae bacterium]|nr:hypothetical protein [Planctomycetaceae bacterium]HRA90151.1 hypothetical protein [Planctomycetaceae bacterium]